MSRSTVWVAAACLGWTFLSGCAIFRKPADPAPTLTVNQGSLQVTLGVDADGFVRLAEHAPLLGRIEVAPILTAENSDAATVQLVQHRGRYYFTAEGFRNLWEVSPQPGTTHATYRAIPVSPTPLSEVRIGRYGSAERTCIRVDAEAGGPWYLTVEGELHERCS